MFHALHTFAAKGNSGLDPSGPNHHGTELQDNHMDQDGIDHQAGWANDSINDNGPMMGQSTKSNVKIWARTMGCFAGAKKCYGR